MTIVDKSVVQKLGLQPTGAAVDILSTGAYTASYASVGFNGFPPLRTYYLAAR
jgi:diaminopimelate decarboxylase